MQATTQWTVPPERPAIQQQLLDYVKWNPDVTVGAAARALAVTTPALVSAALALADAGLIAITRDPHPDPGWRLHG